MDTDDIKQLALKLAVVVDSLETRSEQATQATAQAALRLQQAGEQAGQTAERIAVSAAASFQRQATEALAQGLRDPLQRADADMQAQVGKLQRATDALEQRIQRLNRLHATHAWRTFIACAVGSIAIIGVAVYLSMQAHTALARAEWTDQINAAIASGNLAPCTGGGICARIDGKHWVRLDQAQATTK